MRMKIHWVTSGTSVLEVPDEEGRRMLDFEEPSSAPCDFNDLPMKTREMVGDDIMNTIFDSPIEIVDIEIAEVKKKDETEG